MPNTPQQVINLGQVRAFYKGVSAPSNTDLIWLDISSSQHIPRYFNTVSNLWESLIAPIDDANTSLDKTWSSAKIEAEIEAAIASEGEEQQVIADLTVGGIDQGTTVTVGTNDKNTETLIKLLTKIFYPTFIAPTFSIAQNAGSLREVGQSVDVLLTLNFNRGSINGLKVSGIWQPSTFQAYRAGIVENNGYKFIAATSLGADVIQNFNTYTKVGHIVLQGDNIFQGTVTYQQGPQPIDSVNANFSTPLIAGTSPIQSSQFEGVYPIFATTTSTAVATKQSLVSMLTGNNLQYTLVAEETDSNKQFFELPAAWIASRPLGTINYFSVIANTFDPTNKIGDFTVTSTTQVVQGNAIAMKRYTYNGPKRGSQLIKLIF
jgi:hypothetical protein